MYLLIFSIHKETKHTSIHKKRKVATCYGWLVTAGNWIDDISSRSGTSWCIILYIV